MSKQMKILLGVVGVLVLASVVLTMFGKPPNLPLGPLQGMLAKEEPVTEASGVTDPGLGVNPDCVTDPLGGTPTTGIDPATGAATGPAAGSGAIDPATGQPVDPAAGTTGGMIDPATGQPVDPAAGAATTTDASANPPVAAPADGWTDGTRVTAAGAGDYDASRVSDQRILAADAATDPNTGLPVDPAAAGATDPAAAGATDPATGAPATTTPTEPAAGGAIDPATGAPVVDPCADVSGLGTGASAGAGTGAIDPATGAGATGGAAAGTVPAASAPKQTREGSSNGNSPEALAAAKDATAVMQKANITVSTTATLVPSAGGIGRPAALQRYRQGVTAAVLVMQLDASAQQQWTGAGKKVQINLLKSFAQRLGKRYPKSSRSITVVDSSGNVLAIGDAKPRVGAVVKLY